MFLLGTSRLVVGVVFINILCLLIDGVVAVGCLVIGLQIGSLGTSGTSSICSLCILKSM